MNLEFKVDGEAQLLDNFQKLSTAIQKKLNLHAVKAAAQPIMTSMQDHCPIGDGPGAGLLWDSIGMRTYTKNNWTHAIVGPRHGFVKDLGPRKKGRHKGESKKVMATKYARDREFGEKHANATPFMRPAWGDAGGDVALGVYIADLKDGIALEVAGLGSSGMKP